MPQRSPTGRASSARRAIKTEGIEDLLRRHDDVHAKVDAGYRGLAKAFAGRACQRRAQQCGALQRWIGRREYYPRLTWPSPGLVSQRAARR
jgi:hypothetical protein